MVEDRVQKMCVERKEKEKKKIDKWEENAVKSGKGSSFFFFFLIMWNVVPCGKNGLSSNRNPEKRKMETYFVFN